MITIISAVSKNGVIGQENKLPWSGRYKEDMQFFHQMTVGKTVIMGRSTYESIGSKPLKGRANIVVTSHLMKFKEVPCCDSLKKAVQYANIQLLGEESPPPRDIFLIGGAGIYEEGMKYADQILLTLIHEEVSGKNLTRFPWISPQQFHLEDEYYTDLTPELKVVRYVRI